VRDLFEAIRKRCPSDAWSRGVSLARNRSVTLDASSGDEIQARVVVPGSPLSPRVSLFPGAGEWECDCGSPLEACEHVAAVVIASTGPKGVVQERAHRPILYRLKRSREGILFERGVEDETGFHAIEVPLDAVASGRLSGPRFDATQEDLEVEKALRGVFRGTLPKGAVARTFEALARVSERTTLDGRPVKVSPEPVVPVVRVEERREGFLLRLVDATETRERFRNGVVLAEDVLRPEGEPDLSGREREELRRGRLYRPEEIPELSGRVLPSLQRRVPVEVATGRLPQAVSVPPRLSFLLERSGPNLRVLSRIVYPSVQVPLRDLDAEKELEERLSRELGLRLDREEEVPPEEAIELVAKLHRFGAVLEGSARESFRLHGDLVPSFRVEGSDFDLSFTSGGDSSRRADPGAVLRAFRAGRALVPLREGGFARVPSDWLELYSDAIEDLLAAREAAGSLPRSSLPDLARLAEELDSPPPAGFAAMRAVAADFSELPRADLPDGLRAVLRDYQRRGLDWLLFLKKHDLSALLADDMGLGKTVQALAALERGRNLVAAPTSVLQNWIGEAKRFRPDLSICFYHGPERRLDPSADLTLTSHALLRLDQEVLAAVSWDAFVIDEAQAIRNPETDLSRAAFTLPARFRISLTGTPVENRLVDLWSQFRFLHPGFLGGLSDFEERYVRPTERGEAEPLRRLRERIRPFFLRRLKSEVAPELPPRTETVLRAELDESERRLYDALRLSARKDALALLERGGSVFSALEALLRLRQACCHPALVPGSNPTRTTSSKLELLLSNLETAAADGHKSLVFSQWTSMLDLVEPELARSGHSFVRLDGATSDRAAVVERFQNDPGVSVFLVSLKAGGVGLNLTAADHVFLLDPWWNPAAEEQAFDRAHRIGQEKPVFLYRLVAADTVEERILALQEEKRGLARTAVGEGAFTLTRDDLLGLLD
jgi:superfamily II DNA or RNA helicase